MRKTYLATIQIVISTESYHPEEVLNWIKRDNPSFLVDWRYHLSAPHLGFFREYEYDPNTFQKEQKDR